MDDSSKMQIKYAEIRNAKIAFQTYGSGDPLVLCVGFAQNMDMWSTPVIQALQKKYMVIVFDYRGMGYSTNTDPSMTIQSLAEDLNDFLAALKISKTHVLGWSMGGFVAQMFAIHHPEKVQKLILYATHSGGASLINPSDDIVRILSNPASPPMEMLSTLFPDDWLAAHPEPWKFLPNAQEPHNPAAIGMQYEAIQEWLKPGGGSAGLLHTLNMPVMVLCGEDDKVVPSQNATILADSLKSSTLIRIPNSGHGVMYQLPEIFAGHVEAFLNY